MTAIEIIRFLAELSPAARRVWVGSLFKHDVAKPDCIGPPERPPYRRLLDLCNFVNGNLTSDDKVTQAEIIDAASDLCGQYAPSKDGAYMGIQLLQFAKVTQRITALRAFGRLLAARSLDVRDPDHLNLWLEAHWAVARSNTDWQQIAGWVTRDAGPCANEERVDPVPLSVRVSAIGVWARFGPSSSFSQLVIALKDAAAKAYVTNDDTSIMCLADYTVELWRRTVDDPSSPPFRQLHRTETPTEQREAWARFCRQLAFRLSPKHCPQSFEEAINELADLGLVHRKKGSTRAA